MESALCPGSIAQAAESQIDVSRCADVVAGGAQWRTRRGPEDVGRRTASGGRATAEAADGDALADPAGRLARQRGRVDATAIRRPDVRRPDVRRPDVRRPDVRRPDVRSPRFAGPTFAGDPPLAPPPRPQRGWPKHLALILSIVAGVVVLACLGGAVTIATFGARSYHREHRQVSAGMNEPVRDGLFQFTADTMRCGVQAIGSPDEEQSPIGQFCVVTLTIKNVGLGTGSVRRVDPGGVRRGRRPVQLRRDGGPLREPGSDDLPEPDQPGEQRAGRRRVRHPPLRPDHAARGARESVHARGRYQDLVMRTVLGYASSHVRTVDADRP